jgi:hypothetical protein
MFGTQSLAISRNELTPTVEIERGYSSKSGAVDAGVVFFVVVD